MTSAAPNRTATIVSVAEGQARSRTPTARLATAAAATTIQAPPPPVVASAAAVKRSWVAERGPVMGPPSARPAPTPQHRRPAWIDHHPYRVNTAPPALDLAPVPVRTP